MANARVCGACNIPLTRRQRRYCSQRCSAAKQWELASSRLQWSAGAVLRILQGNRDWFMTASDLAIWLYGYDDPSECHLIRVHLHRLRKMGYGIESRLIPYASHGQNWVSGYRLVAMPTEQEQAA